MTSIVVLIAVIFILLCAFWNYYEFKKWAFFPSLLIVVGFTTALFLLSEHYLIEGACKPIHTGRGRTSNLHCIISEYYEDFTYLLREVHAAEIVIFCLVLSIICLCEKIKERNTSCDKENDSSEYSNDYNGPWQ
ncbi:hypothetical protein [Bartonella sp. AP58NXGY]|uniref:hypothetical protein n=1 Tax=Bartonella sp. AP58NXGY TaxID=3243498 RepID=UPI0035D07862